MKNDDVELIQRILAGDDSAFTKLVRKYQKQVHALAWRKIGDFHIAEEITQDTFLKVYQKLPTLKEPHRFAGWLYVIAARLCLAWLRKKGLETQSLEETELELVEKATYSEYVAEENAKNTVEAQREVVKKLLARLQESERTVIILHYFGEMTCEEISRFLGVSASTVKSRLRRARLRLKKAKPLLRETLNGFQLSTNLTENIMREIAHLKPAAPSGGKPLVPWAMAASTAVLVVMMLGIGNQYFVRFQQPYSFDAASEMTVDIIEAPVVLALEAKPHLRTQPGISTVASKGAGFTPNAVQPEYVSRFLPTQTKNVVLNDEELSQDVLSIFRTPAAGYQDYTVVEIDTTAFKDGGMLAIDIWVGSAAAAGAFILFTSDSERATDGMPKGVLASASGIPRGKSGRITHRFDEGTVFKLGATGNSFSGEEKVNSFLAKISIAPELGKKTDMMGRL